MKAENGNIRPASFSTIDDPAHEHRFHIRRFREVRPDWGVPEVTPSMVARLEPHVGAMFDTGMFDNGLTIGLEITSEHGAWRLNHCYCQDMWYVQVHINDYTEEYICIYEVPGPHIIKDVSFLTIRGLAEHLDTGVVPESVEAA